MIETDICIIGAGPGGAAAALRLANSGIPSVLIDKSKFPRDKICGDGMTGRTIAILNRIDPSIVNELEMMPVQNKSWGLWIMMDNTQKFAVPFRKNYNKNTDKVPCFVVKRLDFDNHLVEKVRKQPLIHFIEEQSVDTHEYISAPIQKGDAGKAENYWIIGDKKSDFKVKAKLLIVANGANSPFTRHFAKIPVEPKHNAAAVRAYYKNVTGCHPDNYIELHFLKESMPGYFWVFPLPNGEANVGFGMLTATVSNRKLNLKKALLDIIETRDGIKERFANATLDGDITGFPLPLGSKRRKLSGDGYMLVGDAACLVDPLTGEGIGNAVFSGYIAAEQAEKCLKDQNFSATYMKDHDVRVWRVMGPELKFSHYLQMIGRFPIVFKFVLWMASKNVQISELVYSMFINVNIKKKLLNPLFWMKMLLNAK
jgi:menaquinone-9 beta-reductase